MTPKYFPKYPTLLFLRLAVAADIKRMVDLSVLAFEDSEIFRYERPRYEEFPLDAVASFANIYRSQMLGSRDVVIVVEDVQRPDEVSHFPLDEDDGVDRAVKRVVVGVASWVLPEAPALADMLCRMWGTRSQALHVTSLSAVSIFLPKSKKSRKGGMTISDKLVVHPSYQGRGHGTFMLQWGLRFCDMDGVYQGVIPSHKGEPLYLKHGYNVVGEIHVPDDSDVEGFSQRVVIYKAKH